MYYKLNSKEYHNMVTKHLIGRLLLLFILLTVFSAVIAMVNIAPLYSMLCGAIAGVIFAVYLKKDLKRFKANIVKTVVNKNIERNFTHSDCVESVYYFGDVSINLQLRCEYFIVSALNEFKNHLKCSELKIIVLSGNSSSLTSIVDLLIGNLSTNMPISEDVMGMFLCNLNCIILRCRVDSLENCLAHEFVHFLNGVDGSVLEDKQYIDAYAIDRLTLFSQDTDSYYRDDIHEFTAELGSYILNNNSSCNGLESAKILMNYLDRLKI